MQFQGHDVLVIRRARRRTMTIHMRPHQPLQVSTAMSVTDDQIVKFLMSKVSWIEKNQTHFEQIPQKPLRQGIPGETWMFKGEDRVLTEAMTLLKSAFVVWSPQKVTVYYPETQWAQRESLRAQSCVLIEDSLKSEALALISSRVQFFASQMQLFPKKIKIMKAKTRWGSCSIRGHLNFNWRLIGATPEVIDAIVVHEMAHLQHMNHSKEFYALVEQFAPHHDAADQWLRRHQHLL